LIEALALFEDGEHMSGDDARKRVDGRMSLESGRKAAFECVDDRSVALGESVLDNPVSSFRDGWKGESC